MADTDELALGDDEFFTLWVLIAQTKDALLRARERDYMRYGISNERRAVLFTLAKRGGAAAPVEIARDLFRETHTVTELLKRMEADELVSRHKGSGRSKVQVRLTEKGREVFEQSLHSETDERIFSELTKDERACLASLLWKVRSSVLKDLGIPEWHRSFPPNPDSPEGSG